MNCLTSFLHLLVIKYPIFRQIFIIRIQVTWNVLIGQGVYWTRKSDKALKPHKITGGLEEVGGVTEAEILGEKTGTEEWHNDRFDNGGIPYGEDGSCPEIAGNI